MNLELGLVLTIFLSVNVMPALAEIECIPTDSGNMCTNTDHRDPPPPGVLENSVYWNPVEGAIGYQVEIFDVEALEVVQEGFFGTNQLNFNKPGLYRVDIEAMNGDHIIDIQSLVIKINS